MRRAILTILSSLDPQRNICGNCGHDPDVLWGAMYVREVRTCSFTQGRDSCRIIAQGVSHLMTSSSIGDLKLYNKWQNWTQLINLCKWPKQVSVRIRDSTITELHLRFCGVRALAQLALIHVQVQSSNQNRLIVWNNINFVVNPGRALEFSGTCSCSLNQMKSSARQRWATCTHCSKSHEHDCGQKL